MSQQNPSWTPEQKLQRRAELEKIITLSTFKERGAAIAEIKEQELYKPDFATFEDYCISRWGIKRAHAYRLMDAAKVAGEVSPNGDIKKETHARALLEFPSERRAEVLKRAIERAKTEHRPLKADDIYDQVEAKAEQVLKPEPAVVKTATLNQLRALWKKSSPEVRAAFLEWTTVASKESQKEAGLSTAGGPKTTDDAEKATAIESKSAGETPVTPTTPDTGAEGGPEFECDSCGETFDDDSDAVTLYECGDCCERFTRDTSANGNHQCPGCNKFGAKISDCGCPECNEGELIKIEGDKK